VEMWIQLIKKMCQNCYYVPAGWVSFGSKRGKSHIFIYQVQCQSARNYCLLGNPQIH